MTDIFNSRGRVDTTIDPALVPEDRRSQFVALTVAQTACDSAEENEKLANDTVAQRVREHQAAVARVPRQSHVDLVKEMLGQAQAPVVDGRAAIEALQTAEHALELARHVARECRDATLAARTAFAVTLSQWNAAQPVATPLETARAFIATSQAERAARAAMGALPYRPSVTATARAMSGGNMRAGGGRAFRRGAYTKAEALTAETQRRAAKLPSDR
jgi:hypothetical protein